MAGITLKVDPEQLKRTADEVTGMIQSLQTDLESLQTTVSRTSYYWQGQAADEYRKNFAAQKDDNDEMLERLRKYPTMLLQMAGFYNEAEKNNVDQTVQLLDNYIDG